MGKHSLFVGKVSATITGMNWSVSSCKCSMNIWERKQLQPAHTYNYSSAVIASWLLKHCNSSMKSINGRGVSTHLILCWCLQPLWAHPETVPEEVWTLLLMHSISPSFSSKSIFDCAFIFISAFLGQSWTPWEVEKKNLNSTLSPGTLQQAPLQPGRCGGVPLGKSIYSDLL